MSLTDRFSYRSFPSLLAGGGDLVQDNHSLTVPEADLIAREVELKMSRVKPIVDWMIAHPNPCIYLVGEMIDAPRMAAEHRKDLSGLSPSAFDLPLFPAAKHIYGGTCADQRRRARRYRMEHVVSDFAFHASIGPSDADAVFRFYHTTLTEAGWNTQAEIKSTSVGRFGSTDEMVFTKRDPPLKLAVVVSHHGPEMRRYRIAGVPSGPDPVFLILYLWGRPFNAADSNE